MSDTAPKKILYGVDVSAIPLKVSTLRGLARVWLLVSGIWIVAVLISRDAWGHLFWALRSDGFEMETVNGMVTTVFRNSGLELLHWDLGIALLPPVVVPIAGFAALIVAQAVTTWIKDGFKE